MILTDLLTNLNTFIGDSSTDRVSDVDRYQAATEATAWLLEELGNEHMTDRASISFLPTVTWYKVDNLTPYLLTAGQLRYKDDDTGTGDFTRIDARDLASMRQNRTAFAIERFNGGSYLGISIPDNAAYPHKDLVAFDSADGLTYTGVNATNILKEKNDVMFDMTASGPTVTGLTTVTAATDISYYDQIGTIICEIEIPDLTGVTSVTIKFGTNLTTAYYSGTVTQDVNGNALVVGVNTVSVAWTDLVKIGTPALTATTLWSVTINHLGTKPIAEGFKFSDLRIALPIPLTFKYIFYRVGKNTGGTDITEFSAGSDVPFFAARYPQYKFAVAHKAAGILYRSLQLFDNARAEDREATMALARYRKNFNTERDQGSSTFKVAGITMRGRRVINRRF